MVMDSTQREKAVQKMLGEPVFCELSERAWKLRSSLLAFSLISIGVVAFGIRPDNEATVLGFKLSGLTDDIVQIALLVLTGYSLLHFLWAASESFVEWRLRITGTRVVFITAARFAEENCDYPSDPRQSTLLNWWKDQAQRIQDLKQPLVEIRELFQNQESAIQEACRTGEPLNVSNATHPLMAALEALRKMDQSLEEAARTINSSRIPASLERFEKWFEYFIRSQNLRWLLVDILVPIVLAMAALVLLFRR